jgi:FkbH-like protein
MSESVCKCILISDFNINSLAGILGNGGEYPTDAIVAPFAQVIPTLMQRDLPCWQSNPDVAIVWTRPESVIESFNLALGYEKVPIEDLLREVDEYTSLILNLRDRVRLSLVPTWVLPTYYRGFGLLDMKPDIGISNTLMRMNLRLSENLTGSDVYVLDAQRWIATAGRYACNPKLWYTAKVAFGNDVFAEAAKDIKSALGGITGDAKKLIILDLDDTLWGGTVGDLGWENLNLGGHNSAGEAYVDFQCALKSLTNRGILLGIVSKNEEGTACEAIRNHPEMILRMVDFAGWKINWQDKAQNVIDLTTELNLGLQSVVFVDDNPVERARVKEALPEVFVPDWPEDPLLYKSALLSLRCFDSPKISEEDRERTQMYVTERYREELKARLGSLDDWLRDLRMEIKIEGLNERNLQRTIQLLNKTNQMNLTTRRLTDRELVHWVQQSNHRLWTFSVSDRFGSSGLTGIASLAEKDGVGQIVDFVLSCRVMGRNVEEALVYTVVKHARTARLNSLYAEYIPTSKNVPCRDFWQRSGFAQRGETENVFTWNVQDDYPLPEAIRIEENFE